jgi:hypothetical protein
MEVAVMLKADWRRGLSYGVPGVLLGLALAWWAGGNRQVSAQSGAPVAESNGTIAFTSASNGSSQLLYLIDTRSQSFAVYRVDSQSARGGGAVKLEAARQYRYDLKLSEYNNSPPEVTQVEQMVRAIPVKH